MSQTRFGLRVPVRTLGKEPLADLEKMVPIDTEGRKVTLRSEPPYLVVIAEPFDTVEDAEAFVPRVQIGLWSLTVRWNVAFRSGFNRGELKRFKIPVEAGIGLSKSLGLSDEPHDGFVDADAVVIYPLGQTMLKASTLEATASVSTRLDLSVPTFESGLKNPGFEKLISDRQLVAALDLFNAHFYESSPRARFLTLMTILEILAPMQEKHIVSQNLIARWQREIDAELANTNDSDAKHALESLRRELEFRRETSIRQRIRTLMRISLRHRSDPDRAELEASTVRAYDARGTLVHTGDLPPNQLESERESALRAVRSILSERLSILET